MENREAQSKRVSAVFKKSERDYRKPDGDFERKSEEIQRGRASSNKHEWNSSGWAYENQRLQLLGRGEEEIEVRVPNRQLTEKEFKEYMSISNRSGGIFDWDILKTDFDIDLLLETGFDSGDLSHIFDDNLEVADENWDEEAELKKIKKTDIKPGDMFALGRHRLICGDALDPTVAKKLTGKVKVDMADVDLPFNISLSYDRGVGGKGKYGGTMNDSKTDDEYRIFVKTIMQNALAVSKDNAHVFFGATKDMSGFFRNYIGNLGLIQNVFASGSRQRIAYAKCRL